MINRESVMICVPLGTLFRTAPKKRQVRITTIVVNIDNRNTSKSLIKINWLLLHPSMIFCLCVR